jgi:hypothetical protein
LVDAGAKRWLLLAPIVDRDLSNAATRGDLGRSTALVAVGRLDVVPYRPMTKALKLCRTEEDARKVLVAYTWLLERGSVLMRHNDWHNLLMPYLYLFH